MKKTVPANVSSPGPSLGQGWMKTSEKSGCWPDPRGGRALNPHMTTARNCPLKVRPFLPMQSASIGHIGLKIAIYWLHLSTTVLVWFVSWLFTTILLPERVKLQLQKTQSLKYLIICSKFDPFGPLKLVIGVHWSLIKCPSNSDRTFWHMRGYSTLLS